MGKPKRAEPNSSGVLARPFSQSLHIRVLDAGACRACLSEIEQLGKPYYNIHRLGFFMTPTPRHADVLLVAGPVADNMRLPLEKAYDAMPSPKRVVAVGACALSGGIFGPSFTSYSGVKNVLPVDVEIPGCPPPPLAIIHGLLVLTGRRPPAEAGATSFVDRRSGT
ncbi:MAG: NADH-quinone oxidoreductase subunit B family protein [Desulfomonilaceae bacterium]